VASVVAVARHVVGFRGFGILIPTAIALSFVSTGISVGLLIFFLILVSATLIRGVLRPLRLHYLPRMALLLWFVTLVILALIFASPYFGLGLASISIFPVLILILMAEDFVAVQIGKSLKEAARLTLETILIAFLGYFIFTSGFLRAFALEKPEWVIFTPLAIDLLVGKLTTLRFFEYWRFKRLLG